jgi:hypothetical protein
VSDDRPYDAEEKQERLKVLLEGLALASMTGAPPWWREARPRPTVARPRYLN